LNVMIENRKLRISVVGAGKRFLSGISYYTLLLVNVLTQSHQVSAILMRQLLPTRLYPGRNRVGAEITQLDYDPDVQVFDGIDWFWLPSIFRSLWFLKRERPEVVVFQWWSGTVLHSYLLLAIVTRLLKARIIIEFHEVLDTGEAQLWMAHTYVRCIAPLVIRLAHGFVVHSEFDRQLLEKSYRLGKRPVALIPHGPYYNYHRQSEQQATRTPPASCCNLLFFGVIRPYKGLEDLIKAFDALSEVEVSAYWLTIVGETWEGWTLPEKLIESSQYRDRITFVNRYVSDAEVTQFFDGADAVVLPYHRSSTSGPLHIAMSRGLPVVVTNVGGLIEAVTDYEGAILVPPQDPVTLQKALTLVKKMSGKQYTDVHSWDYTAHCYQKLFEEIGCYNSSDQEFIVSVGN
jgi:glycosyltransferase involved in cell wall biosynthesis